MSDDGMLDEPTSSAAGERRPRQASGRAAVVKDLTEDLGAVGNAAVARPLGLAEEGRGVGSLVEWGLQHRARLYLFPVVTAALAAGLLAVFEPGFYRPANLHVLMQQISVLGLVTLGQLLVLLVGGIDLSVGAVMNASLIIIALMNQHQSHLLAVSLVSCLCLGALVGLTNGLLVSLRDVPPFAATLGMLACIQGAILVYTKGIPAGDIPSSLRPVALSGVGIVPYSRSSAWLSRPR